MRGLFMLAWVLVTLNLHSTSSSSSSSSDISDLERNKVFENVESNLLSLFGFSRRPKVDRSKVVIPPAMLELYKRQTGRDLDTASIAKPGIHAKSANTVRSFTHIESPIDARFPGHHKFRFFFNVTSVPKNEKLKAAEITLSREAISWLSSGEKDAEEHFQQVLVHDIIRPGIKGKQQAMLRLIDSKMADTRHQGSFSLDVFPAVERWFESASSNHGLLIQIVGLGRNKTTPARHLRLRRSLDEDESQWSQTQPLLFTYTDDGKNKERTESIVQRRARRASAKHKNQRKEGREICRRQRLYVDFTDVGWNDWIVAPPGYEAFYCSGDCPFPLSDHLNTTNHAIVQTLMNSVNPMGVPKVCCVPTLLNSISMLYLDEENKVVLKNYQDMAVLGCGCR